MSRPWLAVVAGVALSLVSIGAGPPPNMTPLTFNPLTASPAQLLAHHFPLRPKGTLAAKAWVAAMQRAKYVVTQPLQAQSNWTAGTPDQTWSGNIDNGSSDYTAVYMTWAVPGVSGSAGNSSAIWAGLGGWYGSALDQAGTFQQVSSGGQNYYQAFTESLPQQKTSVIQFPVHPGDTMYVAVSNYNTSYTNIFIEDETTGYIADPQVSEAPNHSSAEYIMERPQYSNSYGCVWYPVANFGRATINNAEADTCTGTSTVSKYMGNWAHFFTLLRDDSGQFLDNVGAITNGGASNPITFTHPGDTDQGACIVTP